MRHRRFHAQRCQFGGQSGVNGHISVPDDTVLAGHSGIIGTPRKNGLRLMGYPALEYGNYMRAYAKFRSSGAPEKKKSE